MNNRSTSDVQGGGGEVPLPFAKISIVNLPHRSDRRTAVRKEIRRLGVDIDGQRVAFLEAVRPTTPDGFDSIGARGCFLSHLAALKAARDANVSTLLILEDDVAFSSAERKSMKETLGHLFAGTWDVFYGGSVVIQEATPITILPSRIAVQLTHFMAFSNRAIHLLVPYLEAMLTRPAGSPQGGPMHVDGAYSHFRRDHPELVSVAATPPIAHQRASRTDIHALGAYDRLPLLRELMAGIRWIKNLASSTQ